MANEKKTLSEKLMNIQTKMKAPKNLYNSFGKYNYRNAEGILEALKPYEEEYRVSLVISDEMIEIGSRVYVKTIATLKDIDSDDEISATAFAREMETKKGMDDAQVTGATSSYARKYALNGLFLLDDSKDPDSDEYHEETEKKSTQIKKEPPKNEKDYSRLAPRKALLAIATDNDLDLGYICQMCGINNQSSDEDFKAAFVYAKGLIEK